MNDSTPITPLPDLSDAAIARMEKVVFDEIQDERPPVRTADRARRRRRGWLTGAGIAAAFVVGVLVTPPILNSVGGANSTADSGEMLIGTSAEQSSGGSADRSVEAAPGLVDASDPSAQIAQGTTAQEIITTANATLQVKNIAAAAQQITDLAKAQGGYVESTEIGTSYPIDSSSGSAPAPMDSAYGWISIRVPSAELESVIDSLGESGEVLSSSLSKQDVTSTAIDLRARVEATTASVQRLTELMSQSGSVSELIEAELALTDRQAQLESYEQQLAALEDQVAMSSLHVQLTRSAVAAPADPTGFNDGLLAGWNGLVVSLNALVIAIGFLLPWLGLAGVVVLIIWLIRRARRTRDTRRKAELTEAPH